MMKPDKYFDKLDFNKPWREEDWETYFKAQDAYRFSKSVSKSSKKPVGKFIFEGENEIDAFDPLIRAYGDLSEPEILNHLRKKRFAGDQNPLEDYHPHPYEDPHYWGEGISLSNCLIYRDACRFAMAASHEIDRYLKRRGPSYRKKHGHEFESLRFHTTWVAVNIGQGHKLGYSDERVNGNIAKCRRALYHAEFCVSLIGKISLRTSSHRLRHDLFSFSVQIRYALLNWIEELRRLAVEGGTD